MRVVGAMAPIAAAGLSDFGDILGLVAGVAVEPLVGAIQREARLPRMIELPSLPAVRVVAPRTLGTEPALVKLVLMTSAAGCGRILEAGCAVTLLAGDGRVQPNQGKTRDIMVERDLLAPAGLLVALLAARAKLPLMRIVLAVAAGAIGRQLVTIEITRMARVAFDGRVFTAQRELGCFVVVEADRRPLRRGMTSFAFLAVASGVLVLLGMAANAGRGDVLVTLACMTGPACHRFVSTNQGEPSLVVIEGLRFAPSVFAVAILAELAQTPFVRLGPLVTIDAAARSLAKRFAGFVASRARGRLMRAIELEIGQDVIEGLAIEPDDVGRAAFVVGMTVLAIALQSILVAAMEAALPLAIAGDILMALEAEFRL